MLRPVSDFPSEDIRDSLGTRKMLKLTDARNHNLTIHFWFSVNYFNGTVVTRNQSSNTCTTQCDEK